MIVETVIEEPGWTRALPDLEEVAETAARAAIAGAGRDPAAWTLCLLACSDDRIRALNATFRHKGRATNVLSWPAFDPLPADAPGAPRHLGDIALALETVRGEADAADTPLKAHALHLILHAVLPLLGYDHETADEAAEMEGLESRILLGMGIADPHNRGEAQAALPD